MFKVIGFVILAAGLALGVIGMSGSYSNGERVGTISKFSSKGIFCKSWEGELVLGGFRSKSNNNGTSSMEANVFAFSVLDPNVVEEVEMALRDGERVALQYEQFILPSICARETSYVITGVEKLNG